MWMLGRLSFVRLYVCVCVSAMCSVRFPVIYSFTQVGDDPVSSCDPVLSIVQHRQLPYFTFIHQNNRLVYWLLSRDTRTWTSEKGEKKRDQKKKWYRWVRSRGRLIRQWCIPGGRRWRGRRSGPSTEGRSRAGQRRLRRYTTLRWAF